MAKILQFIVSLRKGLIDVIYSAVEVVDDPCGFETKLFSKLCAFFSKPPLILHQVAALCKVLERGARAPEDQPEGEKRKADAKDWIARHETKDAAEEFGYVLCRSRKTDVISPDCFAWSAKHLRKRRDLWLFWLYRFVIGNRPNSADRANPARNQLRQRLPHPGRYKNAQTKSEEKLDHANARTAK